MVFDKAQRTAPSTSSAGSAGGASTTTSKTAESMVFVGKERADNRRFLELCSQADWWSRSSCTPGAALGARGRSRGRWVTSAAACSCPSRGAAPTSEINEAGWIDTVHRQWTPRSGQHPSASRARRLWQVFRARGAALPDGLSSAPSSGFHATEVGGLSKTCSGALLDNNHYSVDMPVPSGRPVVRAGLRRSDRHPPGRRDASPSIPGASGAARSPTIRGTTCRT